MFGQIFNPFIKNKYLLAQLAIREIRSRYKQSIVGYIWVILNPLAQLLIYIFIFSVIYRFPYTNIPYPIFLFVGLLPWIYLQSSLTTATLSLVDNSNLIKKVYFPREVLPYSVIMAKMVDFLFATLILFVLLLIFKINIGPQFYFVVPLLLIQIIFMSGLSLIFSAGNLFYRDVQYLINLFLLLWLYLTPVVYPSTLVPSKFLWLYNLNPMVGIIEGYRSAIFGLPFNINNIIYSTISVLFIYLLGFFLFKKGERFFADIV